MLALARDFSRMHRRNLLISAAVCSAVCRRKCALRSVRISRRLPSTARRSVLFRAQYGALPISERPALITEPGTTLVADTMQFAAPVTAIKSLPGNDCAVLDASIHTAGVISQMRNLPLLVLDAKTPRENLNFTGYTCLEYDILYRGYTGPLDVGSSVIFDNIGSYSNVLKPPFIHPDVPMIEYRKGDDSLRLIKRAQTAEEIFAQYVFEE